MCATTLHSHHRGCSPDLHDPAEAGDAVLGPVAGLDHGESDVPVQEVALVLVVLILPGQGQCLKHFKWNMGLNSNQVIDIQKC